MSILSGFIKARARKKTVDGYIWETRDTHADTVIMPDNNTATTNLGAIKGISASDTLTEFGFAADQASVNERLTSVNSKLESDIEEHSIQNQYGVLYYRKHQGVVYIRFSSLNYAPTLSWAVIGQMPEGYVPAGNSSSYITLIGINTPVLQITEKGVVQVRGTQGVSDTFCAGSGCYLAE